MKNDSMILWTREAAQTGRSSRRLRNTAVFLALMIVLCVAAPVLNAQEEGAQPAGNSEPAEAADSEKDGDEEATEKKKEGPPFIAIPIFITEPAVGYGLGAAVGYFHKTKDGGDSGADSHAPAFTADTAAKAATQVAKVASVSELMREPMGRSTYSPSKSTSLMVTARPRALGRDHE